MRFTIAKKVSRKGSNQYAKKYRLVTVTEVIDRGPSLSAEVFRVMNSVGRHLTDEDVEAETEVVGPAPRAREKSC